MNGKEKIIYGRARKTTHEELTRENDHGLLKKINIYSGLTKEEITKRLEKLYKEWDIERALEVNASALALAGLIINRFSRRRWWVLTGTATGILLQHGIQRWGSPMVLFRKMGVRTKAEINEEIYALKILRGDFNKISGSTNPKKILAALRRK